MCEKTSIFRYLCPSLLTEKDVLDELKIRCFRIKGLERKSREELTQIFIKHLLPLPQRIFPDNHHGKLINKMIEKENQSSRKIEKLQEKTSSLRYGFKDKRHDSKLASSQVKGALPPGDRLKPPIDSVDAHSRKISLSKTQSSSSSSLDRVVIKDRSQERKESTSSEGSRRSSTDGVCDSKKVELKRSCSTSEDSEDISPTKKARQRIAWP